MILPVFYCFYYLFFFFVCMYPCFVRNDEIKLKSNQYLGCGYDQPLGSLNRPSTTGPQLFGSSAVVWYVTWLDSPNWAPWVRFHDWYWYHCLIDRFSCDFSCSVPPCPRHWIYLCFGHGLCGRVKRCITWRHICRANMHKFISNSLDIGFIRGNIYDRSCTTMIAFNETVSMSAL